MTILFMVTSDLSLVEAVRYLHIGILFTGWRLLVGNTQLDLPLHGILRPCVSRRPLRLKATTLGPKGHEAVSCRKAAFAALKKVGYDVFPETWG